jgi:hypothetical protein
MTMLNRRNALTAVAALPALAAPGALAAAITLVDVERVVVFDRTFSNRQAISVAYSLGH